MVKNKIKKSLLRKYRLTIHNENKIGHILGFYVSPIGVMVSLILSFLAVIGIVYMIIVFTPVGEYLPGYVNEKAREKLMNEIFRIDSLENEIYKQSRYMSNIKAIMSGQVVDSAVSVPDSLLNNTKERYPIETTELEAGFSEEFEKKEKYNLTSQATAVGALQELHLYRPTLGMIVRKFDSDLRHYGVDIYENPNENVLAVLDGTVIMSDYTANDGYMLVIQHKQNLTSVYRNCRTVFKRVGDRVLAGEVIASMSNIAEKEKNESGEMKGPYLHFELWHRGEPLDPEIYIAF